MTTRKPKLNLLYVAATEASRLQLAVVTTDNATTKHADRWQAARTFPAPRAIPAAATRTVH